EGTGDSQGNQILLLVIEKTGHAHDSIRSEEIQGHCRVIEVHLSFLEGCYGLLGKRVAVDLQTYGERRIGAYARDCLMEFQGTAPEVLVAEGVEAEGLTAFRKHLLSVVGNDRIEISARRLILRWA